MNLRVHEVIEHLQRMLADTTMPTALTDVREISRDGTTGRLYFGTLVDGTSAEEHAAQAASLSEDNEGLQTQLSDLRAEIRDLKNRLEEAGA